MISELRKCGWNWLPIEYVTSEQDLGSGVVILIWTIWLFEFDYVSSKLSGLFSVLEVVKCNQFPFLINPTVSVKLVIFEDTGFNYHIFLNFNDRWSVNHAKGWVRETCYEPFVSCHEMVLKVLSIFCFHQMLVINFWNVKKFLNYVFILKHFF